MTESLSKNTVNNRSIFKFLIFPKKQLKYAFFYFLIVSVSVLIINAVCYNKFINLLELNTSLATHRLLSEYIYTLSLVTIGTLVIMGLLTFLLTIIFLHRFVGPLRPIILHLEALLNDNYTHKTQLRPNDEINEIAVKLNEVSDHLYKKNIK